MAIFNCYVSSPGRVYGMSSFPLFKMLETTNQINSSQMRSEVVLEYAHQHLP